MSALEPITLTSDGLTVEVLGWGAHLISVRTPGSPNLVLRFDDLDDYLDPVRNPYLGAVVGRYANRIAGARFSLDGVIHDLEANEGPNVLHGGPVGFGRRPWQIVGVSPASVTLEIVSADRDQGFPGQLTARVTYSVEGTALRFEATASTTAPTVVSLTNHAYWNLAGGGSIDRHRLQVTADFVVETDDAMIPTGRMIDVNHTRYDLRTPSPIGDLDDCYVGGDTGGISALLSHPATGRRLELESNQPGLQVYAGLHLGAPWGPRGAICLEPQQLPDAPNQPEFCSAVLRPGEIHRHVTTYRFPLPD